jgi:serine/threonine-protein kinase
MVLSAGDRLGPYEILSALGAGGMGEVYAAHDTKLNRQVAVKILPESITHDPQRVARFRREAQMLAALNHPHIAQIHGLEEANGTQFIVLELVDGESLDKRIARGPIPTEESLAIATQIGEALDAAHEKGIIHRDLKPANIALTKQGQVKVLDFGIAKATDSDGPTTVDISNAPTLTSPAMMTAPGVILGTAAYMSPEQARGGAADKRSDIWAFGCVLYEMLTGRPAFGRATLTDTLAAVIEREPDWSALPPATPPEIRRLLGRCLTKSPHRRLRDIADAAFAIEDTHDCAPAPIRRRRGGPMLALALIAVLIVVVAGLALRPRVLPAASPVLRTTITLAPGEAVVGYDAPVWSPDGLRVAFVGTRDGVDRIYTRSLNASDAVPLPGTEDSGRPFFSADGAWIGFVDAHSLKKVALAGGSPITIANIDTGRGYITGYGGDWNADGAIVFAAGQGRATSLWEVSAMGGVPTRLASPDTAKGERGFWHPQWLPGNHAVLFTVSLPDSSGKLATAIDVLAVKTGRRVRLAQEGAYARVMPGGRIAYVDASGTLIVVGFDADRFLVTADRTATAEKLSGIADEGLFPYDVSIAGDLTYVRTQGGSSGNDGSAGRQRVVLVDRAGNEQSVAISPARYNDPRLSPDGTRLALTSVEGSRRNIWISDLNRGTTTPLTSNGICDSPVWTSDSRRLVFSCDDGRRNLFWQAADGSAPAERLLTSAQSQWPGSVSPDGRTLVYMQTDPDTLADLWALSFDARRSTRPIVRAPGSQWGGRVSPNGRWIAYASDEAGRFEVFVMPFGGGAHTQVSVGGGGEMVWGPSGKELFYRQGARMMSVPITESPALSVGKPQLLFEHPYKECCPGGPEYDVKPDGSGFYMIASEPWIPELDVILNWTTTLTRPTGAAK